MCCVMTVTYDCVDETGSKYKQMLNGRRGSHSQCRAKMTSTPRAAGRVKQRLGCKGRAVVGVSSQPFHCEMCQVSVNSETQLKQVSTCMQHVLLTLLQTSGAAHTASICPSCPCWIASLLPHLPLLAAHEQPETQRAFGWEACQSEVHPL